MAIVARYQPEGLDLFAATWLQQWSEAGGSVAIDRTGKAFATMPEYQACPRHLPADPALPNSVQRDCQTFRDGHYSGGMRALLGLLEAMPGGWDAVRSHMMRHGIAEFAGASGGTGPRASI